jgi:anti-sigma-K factor RskA
MTQEQVKELLPAYALGILSGAETRQCEELIELNPAIRQDAAIWEDIVAELAFAVESQEPPAALRAELLRQIKETPQDSAKQSNVVPLRPRRNLREVPSAPQSAFNYWGLAIAASVAMVALLGALFVIWRKNQSLQNESRELAQQLKLSDQSLQEERALRQSLLGPDGRGAFLQGTPLVPKARANLAYNSKNGQASLAISDLPPAPAGKSYQIWFIKGKQPIPGKTFNTNEQGRADISLQVPDNGLHADTFAVTLEPQHGSTAPTGEKYLGQAAS